MPNDAITSEFPMMNPPERKARRNGKRIGHWGLGIHWSLVIGHWSFRSSLPTARKRSRVGCRAFSLLEMMVAVTLLLVIISALLGMFYQTKRVSRTSNNTIDVYACD